MLRADPVAAAAWHAARARLDVAGSTERAAAIGDLANDLRRSVVVTIGRAGLGHIGGDLSVLDILATLFGAVLIVMMIFRPQGIFGNKITYTKKNYDALKGADALVVVTEWQEFREPDFARMKKLMRTPVVFDGRNIYQPDQMKALGFTYFSIGR